MSRDTSIELERIFDDLKPSMDPSDIADIRGYLDHNEIGLALDDLHDVASDLEEADRRTQIEHLASRVGHRLARNGIEDASRKPAAR